MNNASTSATEASYVYGPDGSLLSSPEGTATTLYLRGELGPARTAGPGPSGAAPTE